MAKTPEHECDCCGHATSGYSRSDLEEDGWVWHVTREKSEGKLHPVSGVFVMCADCEHLFAERRAQRVVAT